MSSTTSTNSSGGLKLVSSAKVCGGVVRKYEHASSVLGCQMKFSVFLPPTIANAADATSVTRVPALYWLSGLTCTDDNFMQKAGAFRAAVRANLALICPDTSPRGLKLPEEVNTAVTGVSWDFGEGAGFYLNATAPAFKKNYNMADYITQELPAVIDAANIGVDAVKRRSIFGHSMGGHGALVSFLRNPGMFAGCSAFAPICNPVNCDWGKKAFTGYLGSNVEEWKQWDACELVAKYSGPAATLLIDQGSADGYLAKQLLPDNLQQAVKSASDSKLTVDVRMQDGYDHSYYFISTFVDDHIAFHADKLAALA